MKTTQVNQSFQIYGNSLYNMVINIHLRKRQTVTLNQMYQFTVQYL